MNYKSELLPVVETLRRGGTILYPTDTLWGIGCDACNEQAIARIFSIKKRSPNKGLIVLIADELMLEKYVGAVSPQVKTLLQNAATPLTIIYPEGRGLAAGVCAANGSVAIRIPQHDGCKWIIDKLGRPLVSTSANLSGNASPAYFADVDDEVKQAVDAIVGKKWEGTPTRNPSSIVQIDSAGEIKTIR
ncbi:threonylcarbamoyl-AMP synthase [Bacteroidia bacterium]|nr:threonylcarbamoyl-AMP synthase [Bacteroidia bacterium]GHT81092.1 threonylcarbamoyl-AMP synthase [Bacteroidia bacterium]